MSTAEIITTFLIGGGLLAGIRLLSGKMNNPALAGIVAGIPTGLLAIVLLKSENVKKYTINYLIISVSTLISIIMFYLIFSYTKLKHKVVWGIALLFWITIVTLTVFIYNYTK